MTPSELIVRIPLGATSAYVIRGPVPILIDSGMVGQDALLRWKLRCAGVELSDIALIVVTHAHGDHAGCLARLSGLTDAAIACSCETMQCLRRGAAAPMKPRTVVGRALLPIMSRFASYPAVDARVSDVAVVETMTLAPFGIDGMLLTTPGHTRGCLSVLVGDQAIVGDLVSGKLARPRTPSVPLLLEDPDAWARSVRLLLDRGARRFHPAHGGPFDADHVAKLL
jgi:glyoxylase-like metal-dependent hydrolase (beta-lactamase superfamily II)